MNNYPLETYCCFCLQETEVSCIYFGPYVCNCCKDKRFMPGYRNEKTGLWVPLTEKGVNRKDKRRLAPFVEPLYKRYKSK